MSLMQSLKAFLTKSRNSPTPGRGYFARSQAGAIVTPDTALTLSTVWRCTNYISQTIAALPFIVVKESADLTKTQVAPQHPVSKIFKTSINSETTSFSVIEALIASALNWGNGYAEIERDVAGRVTALWFIAPDRVCVKRDEELGIYYEVSGSENGTVILFPSEMFHLHGLSNDSLMGYSVIGYASRTLGLDMALADYGSSFFGNGATPGGVLSYPGKLNAPAKDRLRAAWEQMLKGPKNALKTVVLEEGITWTPTTIPNNDAQFLETRKFSAIDVCRWYGVPPNKVYDWDKSTYNNFEQANREVIVDTIIPWARRFEEEVDRKLLGNNFGGLKGVFQTRELLRGDPNTRGEFYLKLFKMAAISPNEIRHLEGMNPIEGGDRYFIAANNLVPLDRIDDVDRLLSSAAPSGTENPPEEETEEETQARLEQFIYRMSAMDEEDPLDPVIQAILEHDYGVNPDG